MTLGDVPAWIASFVSLSGLLLTLRSLRTSQDNNEKIKKVEANVIQLSVSVDGRLQQLLAAKDAEGVARQETAHLEGQEAGRVKEVARIAEEGEKQ